MQNEQQPPAMLNYAPVGFKKMKVPEAVWAHIQVRHDYLPAA